MKSLKIPIRFSGANAWVDAFYRMSEEGWEIVRILQDGEPVTVSSYAEGEIYEAIERKEAEYAVDCACE